ncbi:MAG: HPr family phosphocarrier protein [Clostridia bacterium]|nr:HPr family phosphocarrier protein [Clostridia bacterium]
MPVSQISPTGSTSTARREASPLHTLVILLRDTADIQSFANLVNSYPFTISLRQGRAVTDAKSILGIYSLDLTKPVTVEVYSNQAGELLESLEKYSA